MMKYIVLGLAGISAASAACANPQSIDNQKTRNPPAVSGDSQHSYFDGSSLKLRITSPVVTGRAEAIITPYNAGTLGTEADCIYNQANSAYWTKSLSADQCTELFDLDAAWTDVRTKCDVPAGVNTAAALSFYGSFHVQQDETLDAGALRGKAITRPYINILSYKVTFPKQITILSDPNITVFAPVRLVAAVTAQDLTFQGVNSDPAYHGDIRVLLSFQYPFEFAAAPTVTGNGMTVVGNTGALQGATWTCDDPSVAQSNGRQCSRSLTFEAHEAAGVCQLEGSAAISGVVTCNAGYAASECPIQASDADATVTVTIKSENYCDIVEATADLTGSLASYVSSSMTTARNAYFQDMMTWWLASVSSTNAEVATVSVTDAKADGTSFAAHASYTAWASGNTVEGTGKLLAANEAAFHIMAATTAGFGGVQQDSSKVFVVTADLSVTYTEASRKRMTAVRQVAPVETADVSVAGTAIIEAAPAAEETAQPAGQPAATATTPYMTIVGVLAGVMALLVCCAGVGLFAFVLTRRRSSQQQALVEA